MSQKKMKKIITKYINNEATDAEINELMIWLEDKDNQRTFKDYLRVNYEIQQDKEFNAPEAYKKALQDIALNNKVVPIYKRNLFKYAVAASVAVLISLTFIFNRDNSGIEPAIVNNQIDSGTDKATLTLEDGTVVNLIKGEEYKKGGVISNGEKIVYNGENTSKKDIAYNFLTVPRGGQFSIVLSDGTRVWLNSDTKLKYPKEFLKGETRVVELIYGEAYFDVSSSAKHDGAKFKVNTALQEVEVLGTEFNIKSYKTDDVVYTTLVEGKVAIENQYTSAFLKPNQQSVVSANNKTIDVKEIDEEDVFNEISWKNGVFSFNEKPLNEIVKVLSRWYDIDIVIENEDIKDVKFNGVLRKSKPLEHILRSIINANDFAYEIKDKRVILR